MTHNIPQMPQPFTPDVETIEKDEPETARALMETMLSIAYKTYDDSGHAMRCVHAKSHGLLEADVEILGDLPTQLAQGIFARPGHHQAVIRLSTTPGDLLHDSVSTPRGMALKVMDVEGERLDGSQDSKSQDFVMVNGKEFNSPSAKAFLLNLKGLALTTDKMEGTKEVIAKVMRGVEKTLEALGTESALAKSMGGNPETHILGESFFSQLPHRYGDYIAKFAIVPVSENLKKLTGTKVDIGNDDDAIRHATERFFDQETAVWHLQVQLCSDVKEMPVEGVDAWSEALSPFVTVAVVSAGPQSAWTQERSKIVDDGMSFRPWNGITAHQPLGSIMRVRKIAYERSTAFRSERNPQPVTEPSRCPFPHSQVAAE